MVVISGDLKDQDINIFNVLYISLGYSNLWSFVIESSSGLHGGLHWKVCIENDICCCNGHIALTFVVRSCSYGIVCFWIFTPNI